MPSRQRRSGSGWAIGLGAVLLLVGVTSPAAIWQHWQMTARARLDQAVTMDQAPTPDTDAQATAQQAAPPAPPPPAQPTTQAPDAPSNAPPAPQQQAGSDAPPPQTANAPATTLAPINEGGDLSEAPISAPPQPGSETMTAARTPTATTSFQPAPRPFRQPFQASGPFQQAARPFQPPQATPFHSLPAPLVLKPSLSARLKPEEGASALVPPAAEEGASALVPPAAEEGASAMVPPAPKVASNTPQGVSKPVTRRSVYPPTPQSLDQMFQTLINELASGRPTERQRESAEPSNRR